MSKHFTEKRFKHHFWFKEGKTVGYVLDYLAKMTVAGDFELVQKPAKKQSEYLFDDTIYDDIIRYKGKECGSYKLTQEEKKYFLDRCDYWKNKTITYL